jgi:uncharacterized protein YjbI with pentapeptide repeats
MKATQNLAPYQTENKKYQGKDLKGRSFKRKDLSGADFSGADIRGTDFSGANLQGANFRNARAGLPFHWLIILVAFSWLLAALSGLFLIFLLFVFSGLFSSIQQNLEDIVPGIIACTAIIIFFVVTMQRGLAIGAIATTIVIPATIPIAILMTEFLYQSVSRAVIVTNISGIITGVLAVLGIVVGTGIAAISTLIAKSAMGNFGSLIAIVISIISAITVGINGGIPILIAITLGGILTSTATFFGTYLARRSMLYGDKRDAWIYRLAIAVSAIGGTSFRSSNLVEANFVKATLKNTDFRQANMTRTHWLNSDGLNYARVENSILMEFHVRKLLVQGSGYQKSYIGENLRGANLIGVDLSHSNLKQVDLSEATLRGSNLECANLTEVQAIQTDFTETRLTGACLENWNIDATTILEKIDCQYIFLREKYNSQGSRERRPHNPEKIFEPGDFERIYQKVLNTIQILLKNFDKEALSITFQKLTEEFPEVTSESIQSIERKKDGFIVVTLEVPEDLDKGQFENHFFIQYHQTKLELVNTKELLEKQVQYSQDLKEIVLATLSSNAPLSNLVLNVSNTNSIDGKIMNNSIDASRKIENRDGIINGNILGDGGTISGTVTQEIAELSDSPNLIKLGIGELLNQLKQVIESNLKDVDKEDALEELKVLIETSRQPDGEEAKLKANKAIRMLKRMADSLPTATQFIEGLNKLLPAISSLLGLG